MSSPSLIAVRDDSRMSSSSPGPRSRGSDAEALVHPGAELDHLAAYDDAISRNGGGAYLREQGIYSSQITDWRKLRDAGLLQGKKPGEKIGRLTAEQTEISRLRRQFDLTEQRLETTGVALEIMSKMHELLENLSKSSRDETPHTKP
jgi:transposase